MEPEQQEQIQVQKQDQPQEDAPQEPQSLANLLRTNSFVGRYFKCYYTQPDCPVQQYLYLHSNGIVLVGVMQSYINALPTKNFKISFDCISAVTSDLVKGKKKKGGIKVTPKTWIAQIIYTQGQQQKQINVRGLSDGQIIEFNQELLKKPQWLLTDAQQKGYFAVILPKGHLDPTKHKLIQRQKC